VMLYKVILFLFVFGAVCTGLNTSGIFTTQMPVQSTASISQTQITDLTNTTQGPVAALGVVSFMALFIGSILGGLLAVLSIIPMMTAWGIPLWIALIFQTPLWLVEIAGIYKLVTGIDMEN
jgi:hypothetical protein